MQSVTENPFGCNVGSSLNHEDTVCLCLRTHRLVSSTVHQLSKLHYIKIFIYFIYIYLYIYIGGGNQFVVFLCSALFFFLFNIEVNLQHIEHKRKSY